MTGYRIPWRKIENQSDLPALYSWVITSDDEGCVRPDHRDREGYWVYSFGKVIAWAPLPAPYEPDAPEPVDPRDAEIAALKARCERLARIVTAHGRVQTVEWQRKKGEASDAAVMAERMRFMLFTQDLRKDDLEVSE